MISGIQESRDKLMPMIINFFEHFSTLNDLYQLGDKMIFGLYHDVVILNRKIDEYVNEREKEFPKQFEEMVSVLENNPMMRSLIERKKREALETFEREKQWLLDRKMGGIAYEEYIQNSIEATNKNYKMLTDFGMTSQEGEQHFMKRLISFKIVT